MGWGGAIGMGWFVGLAIVMFAASGLMALHRAELIRPFSIILLVMSGFAILLDRRSRRTVSVETLQFKSAPWSRVEQVLLLVLLVSMTTKIAAAGASIWWNPGRCEDALAYWLYKAKTVTLLGELPTSPAHPFYLGGSNPKYPIFPSMIAAWIPLLVREWHEVLSVIPWLLTFLMLPLAAGLIPSNGTPRLARIIVAYLISSLPLAAIHVFRPGYVDLILASFLMCAVGSVLQWRDNARWGTLILAFLLFTAAACTKREGVMAVAAVVGVFIPFMVLERIRNGGSWRPLAHLLVAAGVTAIVACTLMDLTDLSADAGRWAYHPEAWAAIWRHAMEWSTFSFLLPLAAVVAVYLLFAHRTANAYLAVILCVSLLAYAVSPFLLTDNVRFALNDQTPSRLLLHIAPAMVVALAYGAKRGIACPAHTS